MMICLHSILALLTLSVVGVADAWKDNSFAIQGPEIKFANASLENHADELFAQHSRHLQLEDRWAISIPDFFACETSEWIFKFTISDLITANMIDYELMRGTDCLIDITTNDYLAGQMAYDGAPLGDGNLPRKVALVLTPDTEILEQTPIYIPNADGVSGTIAFCIRLLIYTPDVVSGTIVNWRDVQFEMATAFQSGIRKLEEEDSLIEEDLDIFENDFGQRRRLSVDCSGGFDIVFNTTYLELINETSSSNVTVNNETDDDGGGFGGVYIAPQEVLPLGGGEASGEAFQQYLVEVFECDEANAPVAGNDVRNQGSTVKICVKPNTEAIDNGLYMRSIDAFYFTKNDTGTETIQHAVQGGQPDFFGMSELECTRGSELCWFVSILRAEFFATSGIVGGTGYATVQLGSSSGRQRELSAVSVRMMQQQRERTGFNISFPVLSYREQIMLQYSATTKQQSITLSVLSSILMLALVSLCCISRRRRSLGGDKTIVNDQFESGRTENVTRSDEQGNLDLDPQEGIHPSSEGNHQEFVHHDAHMMKIAEESEGPQYLVALDDLI